MRLIETGAGLLCLVLIGLILSRKKFRFLSIGFVRVMTSMQEIFNLMLARLAGLANLLRIAYGQTTTNQ